MASEKLRNDSHYSPPQGVSSEQSERVAFQVKATKVTTCSPQWPYTRQCVCTHMVYVFVHFLVYNSGKSVCTFSMPRRKCIISVGNMP